MGKQRSSQVVAMDPIMGEAALYDRFAFDPKSLKRDKNGNFTGAIRSPYDSQSAVAYGGELGKSRYKKSSFKSPDWKAGSAGKPTYGGNTDGSRFQVASAYQDSSARQGKQSSRYDGKKARSESHLAAESRANRGESFDKPTDAHTNFRRRVYPDPTIYSREEYEKLSVEQARNILGRDDE